MTAVPHAERSHQGRATLELLWERVRRRGDMPGFTKAISAILGAMRGEDERAFSMTQTVLTDPVLTQKVLRLANSGMYAAFGQRVNTVSKAVMVLGTEAIGHLALGLKLVEELGRATPDDLGAQVEMEKAVLAGMVAQQVASGLPNVDAEEAVVCSILHTLGRMMVTFYLPEQWQQLGLAGGAGGEQHAAPALLGLSLEDIGRATAEYWGLPKNLVAGMRTVEPPAQPERPAQPAQPEHASHGDWLAALSTLSARCADALWDDDAAGAATVQMLVAGFAPMLGIDATRIGDAIERARVNAAAELTIAPLSKPLERQQRIAAAHDQRASGARLLVEGVADLRAASDSMASGQLVALALETVQQGLVFSRAFAFLHNRREKRYVARLGMGPDAQAMLPRLVFDDSGAPDVFHAALQADRVIFIENAHEPAFMSKLPNWWLSNLAEARCFVILPLSRHGQNAGFIYGEWHADLPPVQLSQNDFALLSELRAIVVRNLERRVASRGEADHTSKHRILAAAAASGT